MFRTLLMKRPASAIEDGFHLNNKKPKPPLAIKDKKGKKTAAEKAADQNDDDDDDDDDDDGDAVPKPKTPQQVALGWAKKCDEKKSKLMMVSSSLKGIVTAVSLAEAIKETISHLTAAHKDLQRLGTATESCHKIMATKAKAADKLCDRAVTQLKQSRGYTKSDSKSDTKSD